MLGWYQIHILCSKRLHTLPLRRQPLLIRCFSVFLPLFSVKSERFHRTVHRNLDGKPALALRNRHEVQMQMRRAVSDLVHVDDRREYPQRRILLFPLPECFCQEANMDIIRKPLPHLIDHLHIGSMIAELDDTLLNSSLLLLVVRFWIDQPVIVLALVLSIEGSNRLIEGLMEPSAKIRITQRDIQRRAISSDMTIPVPFLFIIASAVMGSRPFLSDVHGSLAGDGEMRDGTRHRQHSFRCS